MELENFDVEDFDEEEIEKPQKKKNRILTAILVVGINIVVLLLIIIGFGVYTYFSGNSFFGKREPVAGETASASTAIYTEEDLMEKLSEAESENAVRHQAEVDEAKNEGYVLGRNEVLDYVRDKLLTTNSSLETFNEVYTDYIVVVSGGAYHFKPINYELAQSELVSEQLSVSGTGEFQYLDTAGNVISHKGIDVSEFQGNIDWAKVADDGVEFAIIRAFYRGYGTGRLVKDGKVEDNLKGAIDNGVHAGVYVFSQAITEAEAIEEAQSAIETVAPYATNVPIVIDVERVAGTSTRMEALTVEERTNIILTFCKTVEDAGYIPMIYFNTEMGSLFVDIERLEGISKWYAWYGQWMYFPYEYDMWQYRDTGRVNGISGNVDMNIAIKPFWE